MCVCGGGGGDKVRSKIFQLKMDNKTVGGAVHLEFP